MKVSVQFHGKQRIITDTEILIYDIEDPAVISDIITKVKEQFPEMDFTESGTLIVLNDHAAQKDASIKDNDTISFVPVFGGG